MAEKAVVETPKPTVRRCATMQIHHRLLATDARYAAARQRIEERAFRAESGLLVARTGCTEIPVVVHVVWKTQAQNISQAQIESQIRVLNEDFRKTNADVASVPAPFAPLAADARVQFRLATVDPDGRPTDGIVRRRTDRDSFGPDDAIKANGTGGSDPWPADRYLNLWVGQLSGGLLGYAQFPGGPAATDGVVITHTGFGTSGTASAPFNLGRTATHEIGHWLDLRHIWGDDGDGCSGSDFVADTPNQAGDNGGKPTFPHISCGNAPHGDMFMNYMDYVDDDTMVMFSQGQVTRMQAALDGPRSSIGDALPCGPGPATGKGIKEPIKDLPKDQPKDLTKEPVKESPKDLPKDPPKEFPKELPKEFAKELPKEFAKEHAKEFAKEHPKEFTKDLPKDLPKDPPKDFGKDGPKDGPFDPPTKSFLEPPKGFFEPPKTAMEPPIDLPNFGGIGQTPGPLPFVLGTGVDMRGAADQARAESLAAYQRVLTQYAQLNARGLLDAQGKSAWAQAWATYRMLGGS